MQPPERRYNAVLADSTNRMITIGRLYENLYHICSFYIIIVGFAAAAGHADSDYKTYD